MLIYTVVAFIVLGLITAIWYACHRAHGRQPPEVEADGAPPAADRHERWDPRERYDHPGNLRER